MTYDNCMMYFQLGKGYPLKHNKQLETKKDKQGKTYWFDPSFFVVINPQTIKVMGQDEHEAWCSLTYKAKAAPKWLQRCMRDVQKQMQAQRA